MKKIAKWIANNEQTLRDLYREYVRDTKDSNTPFIAFATHMYKECKH